MNDLLNPYIAGSPVVEASMFFGRKDVFDWIERNLVGKFVDHILVLHGQRRVGKTSILKQIPNFLPDKYIQVFFDLQGRTNTTLDRFLWWMASEITRVLKREHAINIPKPDPKAFEDTEYFISDFLPNLRSVLGEKILLLTFDEFDTLDRSEIQEKLAIPLIAYLRRLTEVEGLNFIFSIGSSGDKLENMQASYTDFFKSALYRKISFLTSDESQRLINKPVEGVIQYEKKAVDQICGITSGHPYFTQLICHELFSRCQKTGARTISVDDVNTVLDDVVERGTVNLKFVWDEASDLEKWTLAALAQMEGSSNQKLAQALTTQRVRFSDSDLNSAVIHLRDKDVITADNRFVVNLMQLWLVSNRPMDRVREELVEVNPIANRYIEIGDEYRDQNQFQQAIDSYQQALNADPTNLKAQLNIAGIHLDKENYAGAAEAFELALKIDDEDVAAKTGYCDSYIALGDIAKNKNEIEQAVAYFQKILVINAAHMDARQRLATIYQEQAETQLAVGQEDEALRSFSKATEFTPEDDLLAARYEKHLAQIKAKQVAVWLDKAQKSLSRQRWDEAAEMVEEALKFDPENKSLQTRLAETKDAPRQFKLQSYRREAEQAINRGSWDKAIAAIETALLLSPADQELSDWLKSVRSDQHNARLNLYLTNAEKAIATGDWDTALASRQAALKLKPGDPDLQRALDETLHTQRQVKLDGFRSQADQARDAQNWDGAIAALQAYLQLEGGNVKIQAEIEALHAAKRESTLEALKDRAEKAAKAEDWDEAVQAWENYLRLEPSDGDGVSEKIQRAKKYAKISREYIAAQQEMRRKRYGRAIELLQGIINQEPTYKSTSRLLVEAVEANKAIPVWRRWWVISAIGLMVLVVLSILFGPQIGSAISNVFANRPAAATKLPISEGAASKPMPTDTRGLSLFESGLSEPVPTATPDPRILNSANQHFYFFYDEGEKSWHDARDYCAAQGGYLVTIQNAAENEFVFQLSNGSTWLGATDENGEGIWEWDSGELLEYTNWSDGEPNNANNGDEDYLSFMIPETPTQWNDRPQGNLPFVCEWEPNNSGLALAPAGNTIIVTSSNDSGVGTLRQALLDAQVGDTITFEPEVFPAHKPTTIFLTSTQLPRISRGGITIDASNAGVILDGSKLHDSDNFGLIINSDHNTVMGLQVIHFEGIGIYIEGGSFNQIGGDRSIGAGLVGQGNLLSNNSTGIDLLSTGGGNVIAGNLIGTNESGTEPRGNVNFGIAIEDNQTYHPAPNTIGPDNVIAYNGNPDSGGENSGGILLGSAQVNATITANLIYDNLGSGIRYSQNDAPLDPPVIDNLNLDSGSVTGQTCNQCVVEVFSTDAHDGKIYEGAVAANEYGEFYFRKGEPLTGPYLTATSRTPGGNTSEFSLSTAFQNALSVIQSGPPLYQTSFDSWDFGSPVENAKVENGKLMVNGGTDRSTYVNLNKLSSNRFAIELEYQVLWSGPVNRCILGISNEASTDETNRSLNLQFGLYGISILNHFVPDQGYLELITGKYETQETNTLTFIILEDQIAALVNGKTVFTVLDPAGGAVYTEAHFEADIGAMCEFYQYKMWDLSGVYLSSTLNPDIRTALTATQNLEPEYQTSFDAWDFGDSVENARVENGKLILTSPGENVNVPVSNLSSNRLAIEYDLSIFESSAEGICYFGTNSSLMTDENFKSLGFGFSAGGQTFLEYFKFPTDYPRVALSNYLNLENNTVTLVILGDKNQIATFVNGRLVFNTPIPYGAAEFAYQSFSAEWDVGCEIDNYKLWDLSGIDFNP